jgi:MOSC domain-containing protein YiiM
MPKVAEILIARGDGFVTEVTGEVMLLFGGFAGDRHFGLTRSSCSRAPWHPRGTTIANTRQISIVSLEECASIAAEMGVARIYPSWLGANLATKNIADLSGLPPATRIVFPSGATLFVTEENVPCRHPGKVIAHEYGHSELASHFVKAAMHRRGVLALVEREGLINTDDRLKLIMPRPRPPIQTRLL